MWKKLYEFTVNRIVNRNCGKAALVLDIFPGNISFCIPKKQK